MCREYAVRGKEAERLVEAIAIIQMRPNDGWGHRLTVTNARFSYSLKVELKDFLMSWLWNERKRKGSRVTPRCLA